MTTKHRSWGKTLWITLHIYNLSWNFTCINIPIHIKGSANFPSRETSLILLNTAVGTEMHHPAPLTRKYVLPAAGGMSSRQPQPSAVGQHPSTVWTRSPAMLNQCSALWQAIHAGQHPSRCAVASSQHASRHPIPLLPLSCQSCFLPFFAQVLISQILSQSLNLSNLKQLCS